MRRGQGKKFTLLILGSLNSKVQEVRNSVVLVFSMCLVQLYSSSVTWNWRAVPKLKQQVSKVVSSAKTDITHPHITRDDDKAAGLCVCILFL